MAAAVSSGPRAEPVLPPTWKVDCAVPKRPPGHHGHPRGFGVEGGRTHANHRGGQQQHFIAAGKGEQGDAHQRHQHAGGQQEGLWMFVGEQADPGLQQEAVTW